MSNTFRSMIEIVPEAVVGAAKVVHFDVSKDDSMWTAIRGGSEYVPPGRYAKLIVGGSLVMSDTAMEHRTNYEVVRNAHGNVLIAGLGLGMILVPILAKDSVRSVTVVEKSPDVVSMIGPLYPSPKLAIVTADIFEWKPAKAERFNAIYFDIWSDQSTDDLEDMTKLHSRFARSLDRTDDAAWMGSWRRDELRARKRREARDERWMR